VMPSRLKTQPKEVLKRRVQVHPPQDPTHIRMIK
jgi:hypothetical protein